MNAAPDLRLASLIIDNARSYAIMTVTREGVITGWMAGAEEITGYSADEAVGQPLAMLFTLPDRLADAPEMELERALKEGRAEDSRWHLRKGGERFWANGQTMAVADDPGGLLVKIFRDETPAKLAEEQRVLLLNELNHRVKNTLATVQSVVDQTLRASGVGADVRQTLTARLIALSEAHNVLVQESWAGADLGTVVDNVFRPYAERAADITIDGPAVRLNPAQAIACAMSIHELSTNAVKYGALSRDGGRVTVEWNVAQSFTGQRSLTLVWIETGGPEVAEPTQRGFGLKMMGRIFANQPQGRTELEFLPSGLRCLMFMNLLDEAPPDTIGTVGP
jgi:PAS domain S-box-containing protein